MPYEDARMRAARLFREAVTRDPSLYKEFAPKFQTVGLDISMGAPKGWTLPAMPDTSPGPFGDRNLPRPRPDMPPGFTAADDPYLARQNMPPPASGLAPDAPFMANPAVAAGAMQPASSLYPGFTQAPERERATGSPFSGTTRRRLDANALAPLQQLSSAGPPSPLTGMGPPSPLAQAGGQSPTPGVGPPAPIIGRETPPGLNGQPSPLASRFGDQSQLPSGAFSGSLPRPPQARPFESMIAARPMPPGGPGSLPAAPVLAGRPFPSAPGMASRFGDNSQLASGAFSGGPPPPMATGPTPPTPLQLDAARDQVRQMASLPQVAPPRSLQPLETTPTSTMPNPLQRQPLDLAAGVGAQKLPLGSTSLPFAAIPPTPASVAQRTEMLGPLPPGVGTGVSAMPAQVPLGTSRGVPNAPAPELPPTPAVPPVNSPPSMIASIPPANIQSGNLNDVLALSGTAPPPAITPTIVGQRTAGTPRGKGVRQAIAAAAPSPVVPAQQQEKPFWNAPNIATVAGGIAGFVGGGPGGAIAGASGGRVLGKIISAIRNRGQTVDAQGNILDKAGNIVGHISDKLASAGSSLGGIFGGGGGSSGGMGMGGWSGSGGWGGGSSYTGGSYGGNAGANINAGVGQRFGQR